MRRSVASVTIAYNAIRTVSSCLRGALVVGLRAGPPCSGSSPGISSPFVVRDIRVRVEIADVGRDMPNNLPVRRVQLFVFRRRTESKL